MQLTLRTAWRTSDRFGFIKSSWLQNDGDKTCQIDLLDGLQNLLPYGATTVLQTTMSSLLHAYKRNELEPETGLGIFALSATLTDRAEPSESLKATVAWQVGLDNPVYLLCTEQMDGFRYGRSLTPEQDICGKAGAYLVSSTFALASGQQKQWHIVADVNQDSAAVTQSSPFPYTRNSSLSNSKLKQILTKGRTNLISYRGRGRWFAAVGAEKRRRRIILPMYFSTLCAAASLPMDIRWNGAICWILCRCRNRAVLHDTCGMVCQPACENEYP